MPAIFLKFLLAFAAVIPFAPNLNKVASNKGDAAPSVNIVAATSAAIVGASSAIPTAKPSTVI